MNKADFGKMVKYLSLNLVSHTENVNGKVTPVYYINDYKVYFDNLKSFVIEGNFPSEVFRILEQNNPLHQVTVKTMDDGNKLISVNFKETLVYLLLILESMKLIDINISNIFNTQKEGLSIEETKKELLSDIKKSDIKEIKIEPLVKKWFDKSKFYIDKNVNPLTELAVNKFDLLINPALNNELSFKRIKDYSDDFEIIGNTDLYNTFYMATTNDKTLRISVELEEDMLSHMVAIMESDLITSIKHTFENKILDNKSIILEKIEIIKTIKRSSTDKLVIESKEYDLTNGINFLEEKILRDELKSVINIIEEKYTSKVCNKNNVRSR